MDWFRRVNKGLRTSQRRSIPDNLWKRCKGEGCEAVLYLKELEKNLFVCSECGYHFRISGNEYINLLADDGQFDEFGSQITSADPLRFKTAKKYSDQLKEARKKTDLNEAVRTGLVNVNGVPAVLGVMDFSFIGGSMGSAVGEKVARAIGTAISMKRSIAIVSSSGGARMQEGALSLMQMAKTSAKLGLLSDAKLPYVSILTDPTTGGVTASYAMLGDIIMAEPGALVGFAGPRVIRQTTGEELPSGFQRAEFLLERGFIDMVVSRHDLKKRVSEVFEFLHNGQDG